METSEKLKLIRKKLGISQRGLSEKLKISRGYVAELECGAKTPSKFLNKKIHNMFKKHCVVGYKFSHVKKEPLVEVMTPVTPKLSWFKRLIGWIMEK